jgi:tetratricopeptide (TPR) repeat protein
LAPREVAYVLVEIAAVLAAARRPDDALVIARSIDDAGDRSLALAHAAGALARERRHHEAGEAAAEALKWVEEASDKDYELLRLERVIAPEPALVEIRHKALERALQEAREAGDPSRLIRALARLSELRVQQSDSAVEALLEALRLVPCIAEPARQVEGLKTVMETLAGLRASGPGRELLDEALGIALVIEDEHRRASAVAHVLDAMLSAPQGEGTGGDLEAAVQSVLTSCRDRPADHRTLAAVGNVLVRHGLPEPAVEIASVIQDAKQRAQVLRSAMREFVLQRRDEEVFRVYSLLESPLDRAEALAAAAQALASHGQSDEALETARLIEDPRLKTHALFHAAASLAHQGRTDEAVRLVLSVDRRGVDSNSSQLYGEAVERIASALADEDRRAEAIQFCRAAGEPYHGTKALLAIARHLLSSGRSDEARAVFDEALRIGEPAEQDDARKPGSGALRRNSCTISSRIVPARFWSAPSGSAK